MPSGRGPVLKPTTWFKKPRLRSSEPWSDPLAVLRSKWSEVPGTSFERTRSTDLLQLNDAALLAVWEGELAALRNRNNFHSRAWYHELYRDMVRSRTLLDVGCGFGLNGILFSQMGAQVTMLDVVESNILLAKRLCALLGMEVSSSTTWSRLKTWIACRQSLMSSFAAGLCCMHPMNSSSGKLRRWPDTLKSAGDG